MTGESIIISFLTVMTSSEDRFVRLHWNGPMTISRGNVECSQLIKLAVLGVTEWRKVMKLEPQYEILE